MSWNDHWIEGNTPWDQGAPSALVMRLAARLPPNQRILVPGCGGAWEVEALADLGHQVTGLDLAPAAVEQARARISDRADVSLVAGDFFDPPLSGPFDAIAEHTCFCAVGPEHYAAYARSAAALLKPGGILFGAFLDFEGEGPPFGTNEAEIRAVFSADFDVELSPAERFGPIDAPQLAGWLIRR